jgi:uncharacterized protein YcsI (UPF0317 family)
MEVRQEEIKNIKTVGRLYDEDVKMIVTKGGLHIFVGKRSAYGKAEAIGAASHPALGLYHIGKTYTNFEPILAKSEEEKLPFVTDCSSLLTKDMIDKGIELHKLNKNNQIDFVLSKHGLTLGEYKTEVVNNNLVIKSHDFNHKVLTPDKGLAKSLTNAMLVTVKELKLGKIEKN